MTRDEKIAKVLASPKCRFMSKVHGNPIIMTSDAKFVAELEKQGASTRWFDRTEFSTRSGKSPANMDCEVILTPRFLEEVE